MRWWQATKSEQSNKIVVVPAAFPLRIWSTLLARAVFFVDCIPFAMAFVSLHLFFSFPSKTMFQFFVFLITVSLLSLSLYRLGCVSLSWIFGMERYRISSQFVYWIKCLSLSLSLYSLLKGAAIFGLPPESNHNRQNVVIKFTFENCLHPRIGRE